MDGATIFALSSGAPPAAIGVFRISGPRAKAALTALAGTLPPSRRATLRWLRDPDGGEPLDRALLLWLPGPGTATGEDLAELHIHGGRAVIEAVSGALSRMDGLRLAEPGEFTRRAFANGVLDLAEAEGLADLLAAETETQRRNAQLLVGGAIGRRVAGWQRRLLGIAAQLEALIEFDEGEGVAVDLEQVRSAAAVLAGELDAALRSPPAERLKDGIRVVIAGPPNAGKSTLLNALAGRDAAITSPIAGTTRDVIEVPIAISGVPFLLIDTAGQHEGGVDPVERIGISRARAAAETADILLWLGEPQDAPTHHHGIVVHARCDLPGRAECPAGAEIAASAESGAGLSELLARLVVRSSALLPGVGEVALNRRQRSLISECASALAQALVEHEPVLVAEQVRVARGALDRLTGAAGTEQMLDALFGQFCIGK